MTNELKIIALVGPESTGKTTLAEQLATNYNGSIVPEFAREFINKKSGLYTKCDLITIAQCQFEAENATISKETFRVFCDTDVVVIMVWMEFKYGDKSDELESIFKQQLPRKYLLTYPDLPWEDDPLRENPKDLDTIFNLYVKTLDRLEAEYSIVRGIGDERLKNAINHLQ